jgi:hypothetical protein
MKQLLQSPTLTAFVHNGGTKCTVVGEKKIISYDITFEKVDGRYDLLEHNQISSKEWNDPI